MLRLSRTPSYTTRSNSSSKKYSDYRTFRNNSSSKKYADSRNFKNNALSSENAGLYAMGDDFFEVLDDETSVDTGVSLLFDPDELFKEGMTEEEFVNQYVQTIAAILFNLEKSEVDGQYDLSSVPEEDLKEIEEIAKTYFDYIDKDDNGVISEDEIDELASRDGDTSFISDEDIISLAYELFPEEYGLSEVDETDVDETDETESSKKKTSKGGGYSGSSSNVTPDKVTYTLEQLKEQRDKKQKELDSARADLQKIYEDGNKAANSVRDDYYNAVQNDKEVTDELKVKQKENLAAIKEKEKEVGSLKSDLVNVNAEITSYNAIITAKDSQISALEAALSALPSSSNDGNDKSTVESKRSEINEKIKQAKADKEAAENKLKEANTKKADLETKIETAEKELAILNTEKGEIDNKIQSVCTQDTKDLYTKYLDAGKESDTAIKQAEEKIAALQKEVDDLNKQINFREAGDIRTENRCTKLTNTYTHNSEEYLCILPPDKLESFIQNEWINGNYNIGSNCLSVSNIYCKDLIKKLNLPMKESHVFNDDSQEVIEQKIIEVLDSGYPITIQVSTKMGTRHYATAVGYRITADGKVKFLLADNVLDSGERKNGIMGCGEGERRHLITGYSTPYANQNYGYSCTWYWYM